MNDTRIYIWVLKTLGELESACPGLRVAIELSQPNRRWVQLRMWRGDKEVVVYLGKDDFWTSSDPVKVAMQAGIGQGFFDDMPAILEKWSPRHNEDR